MNKQRTVEEAGRLVTAILGLCFFVSGAAGLIYEVLWAKYLSLFVGSTGLAQIIVLGTFMGGLALGSHVFGRLADRAKSALRLYVFLELGIGAYALLFNQIFLLGRVVFIGMARSAGLSATGLTFAKIASCILCILLPTFLMGGTLPALGRHLIRRVQSVGPKISLLYFLNSFGAVFGCLLAGFHLIRTYGLEFSMVVGGALNIASGIVAMLVLAKSESADTTIVEDKEAGPGELGGRLKLAGVVVLTCVALSGAVSMAYEVAWVRLLSLVLGTSTYSFSIMLATFIFGLSLGGLLLSFRKKPTGYVVIFGLCEVLVGLTVLLTLPLYIRLPYIFNQVASSLSRDPESFPVYQLCKFLLCGLVMIVPTILQGITLPAAVKVLTREMTGFGRRVGLIFAVNTVGTLAGVVFAGFIGLPFLGIKGTLELAIVVNGVLGLVILFTAQKGGARRLAIAVSVLAMTLTWGWYAFHMGNWDRDVLSSGVYRSRDRIPSYGKLLEEVRKRKTIFYRDGVDATIAVQDITSPVAQRVLVINGKVDASTVGDLPTQKMIAHLPVLCGGSPKRVLIVGVGSGATIGSVLAHDVERVDVVELSKDVIDASKLFDQVNGRYWEDPRVRVYWEDAKTFLQITDTKYDIIISEPTNPWIAGVAGVFSREYFENCRRRLAKGGFFVQWIQAYEMEDSTFYMMLQTFTGVFPCYTMWNPTRSDTVFVGSVEPYRPNLELMQKIISRKPVHEDLVLCHIESLLPILGMQMTGRSTAPSHVHWFGVSHSDFFPVLEYVAPRGFFVGSKAEGVAWLDSRRQSPSNSGLLVQEYLAELQSDSSAFAHCVNYFSRHRGLLQSAPRDWAREWARRYPNDPVATLAYAARTGSSHAEILSQINSVADAELTFKAKKLRCSLTVEDYRSRRSWLGPADGERVLTSIQALLETAEGKADTDLLTWAGELQHDLGRYGKACASLRLALANLVGAAPLESGLLLCRALLEAGEPEQAAAAVEQHLAPFRKELRVRLVTAKARTAMGKEATDQSQGDRINP